MHVELPNVYEHSRKATMQWNLHYTNTTLILIYVELPNVYFDGGSSS